MKARAAVLHDAHKPFEIMELDLDAPKDGEVLIRYVAAGLCHSDLHLIDGDLVPRFPIVGGHEGAGIIEEVGPGVTKVKPGDHAVCSFIPNCGTCRYCSTGRQNLCDMGATILEGVMPDGTTRFHSGSTDIGGMCILGTFSERATISQHSLVKVDDWLPLETAVLVGCGVPTGWATANYAGGVRAGDTTVIYGIGGIGINAVQGAAAAGAKNVVVVDPLAFKRETALKLGATHAFASADEAAVKVNELTWGQMADQALVTVGTVEEEVVTSAFNVIGKGGTVVITGLANPEKLTVHVSGGVMTLFEKTIKGTLFGSANPQYDIVKLLRLYDAGQLKLDELVTTRYTLDQVNEGYQDLRDGKNIRGVIVYDTNLRRSGSAGHGRRLAGGRGQHGQMVIDARQSRAHGVDRHMRRAGGLPLPEPPGQFVGVAAPAHPALQADAGRVPARSPRRLVDLAPCVVEAGPGWQLREPAVGQAARPLVGAGRLAADPHRDRALHRQRRQSRPGDLVEGAMKRHGRLGP